MFLNVLVSSKQPRGYVLSERTRLYVLTIVNQDGFYDTDEDIQTELWVADDEDQVIEGIKDEYINGRSIEEFASRFVDDWEINLVLKEIGASQFLNLDCNMRKLIVSGW